MNNPVENAEPVEESAGYLTRLIDGDHVLDCKQTNIDDYESVPLKIVGTATFKYKGVVATEDVPAILRMTE